MAHLPLIFEDLPFLTTRKAVTDCSHRYFLCKLHLLLNARCVLVIVPDPVTPEVDKTDENHCPGAADNPSGGPGGAVRGVAPAD